MEVLVVPLAEGERNLVKRKPTRDPGQSESSSRKRRAYHKDLLCYSFETPLHFFICPSEQPCA